MQDKHAYLIIASGDFHVLDGLLTAIDDCRNDIYIHFDKKCVPPKSFPTRKSRLYVLKNRIDVRWGSFSLLEAEFSLFREARINGPYSRYHVLSGVDMPVKTQDYIHSFFGQYPKTEFVGFQQGGDVEYQINRKIRKYHVFSESFGKDRRLSFKNITRFILIKFQDLLGYKRNKDVQFYKGCQWCSVTDSLAIEIVNAWPRFQRLYNHTFCPDEVFIHTLAKASGCIFYDELDEYHGCLRAIRWENGGPHIWTADNVDALLNSDSVFARKFSDKEIDAVELLLNRLLD